MNRTLFLSRNLITFGVPISLFGILILLIKSSLLQGNEILVVGITADLLLTVPLVYFLLIRKTEIPKTTVIPIMIIGLLIGSYFLPNESQYYLNFFKNWILPIVEISALSFVIYNVRKVIKQYKSNKTEAFDFFTTLKNTCYEILPKRVVIPIVMEIAVFYYGFIYWKKRKLKVNEFSYHKDSGTIALLISIIFIVAIETFVLHILLSKWSDIAAWILTFLSIYSGIQILGFLRSMFKRPISIENDRLYIRYGIMTETAIDIKDIDSIEISSKDIELNKETKKLSFLGELESHNIIIHLKKENELVGLYGIRRKYKNLAFYVDDKIEFTNQINKALQYEP
ncbi:hypothetical protein QYS49_39780 [Marivirga salinae]|uniref:Beta-carotene 15,15'-monooxygenase n=1 Tax=Marivirga salinarum TaxID=3059078 RepID=A0AA51NAJ6_9BACT|nr:hypothetical protein [Marivirga sp. BDSF4-3]WMN11856.1 hypothetical protein QYS49_39780 [Marivirga sp. BDSF4-3]